MNSAIKSLFSSSTKMPDNTSINDIVLQEFRVYICNGWNDVPISVTNGTLLIIPRQGNNLTQIYFPVDVGTNNIYVRSRYSSGLFSNWKKIAYGT